MVTSFTDRTIPTGTVAVDLEAFAQHAGRSTIKVDDVMLLARRNEGLEGIMKECANSLMKKAQSAKKQRNGA